MTTELTYANKVGGVTRRDVECRDAGFAVTYYVLLSDDGLQPFEYGDYVFCLYSRMQI